MPARALRQRAAMGDEQRLGTPGSRCRLSAMRHRSGSMIPAFGAAAIPGQHGRDGGAASGDSGRPAQLRSAVAPPAHRPALAQVQQRTELATSICVAPKR
jgi:hypothetical protein